MHDLCHLSEGIPSNIHITAVAKSKVPHRNVESAPLAFHYLRGIHTGLAILLATVLLTHPHRASFQQQVQKLREIQASTLNNIAGNVASNIAGNVEHVQLSSNIAHNFQLS